MEAVFVELPAFERNRSDYFDEESFADLLDTLMAHPFAGDVIEGTGGLRKLRFVDPRRGKGTPRQREALREALKRELKARRTS